MAADQPADQLSRRLKGLLPTFSLDINYILDVPHERKDFVFLKVIVEHKRIVAPSVAASRAAVGAFY